MPLQIEVNFSKLLLLNKSVKRMMPFFVTIIILPLERECMFYINRSRYPPIVFNNIKRVSS